jgi:hypothetical protein
MGGAGVDRPPSLICAGADAWRAALVPFFCMETLRPDVPRKWIAARRAKAPAKSIPGPVGSKAHWHAMG